MQMNFCFTCLTLATPLLTLYVRAVPKYYVLVIALFEWVVFFLVFFFRAVSCLYSCVLKLCVVQL